MADYRICAAPVANHVFGRFLSAGLAPNRVEGTYLWLNDVNTDLPLQAADGAYTTTPDAANRAAVGVTWFGAVLFALAVGGRLPTEAEWEVAARSGIPHRIYPWGDALPSATLANFDHNVGHPTAAGCYPPNDWGLYDVVGTVQEWTADWYWPDAAYPIDVGCSPSDRPRVARVVRGGSWNKGAEELACSFRRGKWPRHGSDSVGFRVAFDVDTL